MSSADDVEITVIALTNVGVSRFRIGGGCQLMGKISMHSYPEEGENGDPCTCGETRRGQLDDALSRTLDAG